MAIPTIQSAPSAQTAAVAAAVTPPAGWPLLRLAFRPFYLGAAVFAVLAIPLWLALLLGPPGTLGMRPAVDPLLWHAHEMLFGFALAVVVGFLLTAGKAWTGLATPRGAHLGMLALLWASARVAALTGPYAVYALLDLMLLPLVAAVMIELLLRAGNKRNLPLAGVLVLLTLANAAFHLGVIGVAGLSPLKALYAALALIIVIECVMAGRVVPAFTANATPGLKITTLPALERSTLATTVAALALWLFAPAGGWLAAAGGLLFFAAAALHVVRQWRWRPGVTLGRPILWSLHAGYVWIAIGFVLLGLAQFGRIANTAGVHALAVGATAGLIIAMMTRTARGHTGRPLVASRAEVAAYVLVAAAALLRVLGPLAAPQWTQHWLIGAALAWCAGFAVYLAVFAPWLLRTRLDGKDG